MSKTRATALAVDDGDIAPGIASSAVVIGRPSLARRALLSEGAVVRASGRGVWIGTGSAVIENCIVIGTPTMPTAIGRRTTFGHRCIVIGATVGDLCEIGNASILMPGARLRAGRHCDGVDIDGFPAAEVGRIEEPRRPPWALHIDDLPSPTAGGARR